MDNESETKRNQEAQIAFNKLRDAVQGLATLLDKNGAMATGWVLACEWMDSEGNVWFSTHADPEGPVWRVNGLLSHAQAFVTAEHFEEKYHEGDNS